MIDVNALIGPYPFRHVPHPDPDVLVRVLDREGLDGAWVGHLPSAFYRDPTPGNAELYRGARARSPIALRPVPAIRPDWPRWERALATRRTRARRRFAPIRRSGDSARTTRRCASSRSRRESREWRCCSRCASRTCGSATRWTPPATLSAAAIRSLARAGDAVRLVVTAAGREMIEEVHWGLTRRRAAARVLGHLVDLGSAGGPSGEAVSHDRRAALRVRHAVAAAADADAARESRSACPTTCESRALADADAICAAADRARRVGARLMVIRAADMPDQSD